MGRAEDRAGRWAEICALPELSEQIESVSEHSGEGGDLTAGIRAHRAFCAAVILAAAMLAMLFAPVQGADAAKLTACMKKNGEMRLVAGKKAKKGARRAGAMSPGTSAARKGLPDRGFRSETQTASLSERCWGLRHLPCLRDSETAPRGCAVFENMQGLWFSSGSKKVVAVGR